MLVLTRKENESIIINDDITITILGRQGISIRVGITAPEDVSVHRQEVWERIQNEKNTKGNK